MLAKNAGIHRKDRGEVQQKAAPEKKKSKPLIPAVLNSVKKITSSESQLSDVRSDVLDSGEITLPLLALLKKSSRLKDKMLLRLVFLLWLLFFFKNKFEWNQ